MTAAQPKLAAVELVRVRLALRRVFRASHGIESVREVVLVRAVGTDGTEGWGECSALEAPTYTGEYTDGAWAVLRDYFVPAALAGQRSAVRGHPFAANAMAMAVEDLARRSRSGQEAGGAESAAAWAPGLAWTAVLGVPSVRGDLEAVAAEAVAAGASGLKMKIEPGHDVDAVRLVAAVAPDLALAVDANGAYAGREDRLVAVADQLRQADPDPPADLSLVRSYIEQPLPADDLLGHAELAPKLGVAIALDESIRAARDVETAWALGATQLVNVKPARLDGMGWGLGTEVPPIPSGSGPGRFLGGMLETGVGRSAALGRAGALDVQITDLGPSQWYFEQDITDPIELSPDGRMRAPEGAGLTLTPRPERLTETAVDRLLIRR